MLKTENFSKKTVPAAAPAQSIKTERTAQKNDKFSLALNEKKPKIPAIMQDKNQIKKIFIIIIFFKKNKIINSSLKV